MENFFLERFVCWCHVLAQKEYEARSRNWIWLDKFTSYVIKVIEVWETLMFIYLLEYLSNDFCVLSQLGFRGQK